jgi:hypothetical protein
MESRMPSRQVGFLVLAGGVLVALFCGLAETIGIGGGSFGWKQAVGVGVGVVAALAGLYIIGRSETGTTG